MNNTCKCGNTKFFTEQKGNSVGLYCSSCGKWQKWLNKDEIRAFEHSHKTDKKLTNADRIRKMSDEELATFLLGFELDCNECMNKYGICVIRKNCRKFAKEWLQSEAKESETE